jgi:hypothetical protein
MCLVIEGVYKKTYVRKQEQTCLIWRKPKNCAYRLFAQLGLALG